MKNKLFISHFESCTENGFLAKSMCDTLLSKNDCLIRCLPDFFSPNQYDNTLSKLKTEKTKNIDTVIQYISIEDIEYLTQYKNIVVVEIKNFIKQNLSLLDKLSLADEIWVFDKQQKEFLGKELAEKVKIIGYPYSKNRIAEWFDNKFKSDKEYFEYYTVTSIGSIENLESLIYNFILTFNNSFNSHLSVYIKNIGNKKSVQDIISKLMDNISKAYIFLDSNRLNDLVSFYIGNPYDDIEPYVNQHVNGDCYINIDWLTNPDILTASYLGKYILSITDISDIVYYSEDCKISTTTSNYRQSYDKIYHNEYNSYPKINDISMQNCLVQMNQKMLNKIPSKNCYLKFNGENLFL